ncbi:MAG: DUF2520 domain-containing protein [Balneolales bacterium]|nr:DUF2520 domain-containing protein [Balneolales bacterium]
MIQPESQSFTIIGAGRVGKALGLALHAAGHRFHSLISSKSASELPEFADADIQHRFESVSNAKSFGDVCFICVPDDQISSVCEQFPNSVTNPKVVSHVSGACSSTLLEPLRERGIKVASFHPMQTFSIGAGSEIFVDTLISIEGDEEACLTLQHIATNIAGKPRIITAEMKTALHIAGVAISNFMSAQFLMATDILSQYDSSVDQRIVREQFGTIARTTLENIISKGFPSAITGPASRGDLTTVQLHIDSIHNEELRQVYILNSLRLARESLPEAHPLITFLTNS